MSLRPASKCKASRTNLGNVVCPRSVMVDVIMRALYPKNALRQRYALFLKNSLLFSSIPLGVLESLEARDFLWILG